MFAEVRKAGFTDLQETHFSVFSYPLPNGVKPSDLARRLRMSRQATNYLVGQLEQLGYLERRLDPGKGQKRLVYLTDRGWRVGETIFACLQAIEAEWADQVGASRFDDFMSVLRALSAAEGKDPVLTADAGKPSRRTPLPSGRRRGRSAR
ncbi:MAG TPA: MarR family transcriptional regulator [Hyphomicrobiaceae bacterium]|nr:MarR family transcriptional regulator [Hyphomicrobiaceae bacterium]